MEQGQVIQRVDDLQFLLFQRSLHPELFRIDQVKRIDHRRYSAEIWIVGLSHVVTVNHGRNSITELITDETEVLPKAGLANSFPFRGEKDHMQSFGDDMRYILSSQVERMTANLFAATHRDLVRHASKRGIFRTFDDWTGEDGLQPFTFIDFESRDEEFHVHAFHAFPEDLTILKMQSIFEAPNARGR